MRKIGRLEGLADLCRFPRDEIIVIDIKAGRAGIGELHAPPRGVVFIGDRALRADVARVARANYSVSGMDMSDLRPPGKEYWCIAPSA
jgi:hypothetical protein